MGSDVFDARPDILGERSNDILGFDLRELCLTGPEDRLTLTQFAQPALFALSYALWDEIRSKAGPAPAGAAGHSLGEYTALTAADVIGFDAALALVAIRGTAMGNAASTEPSGMAALIGADEALAEAVCVARNADGGRLQVANLNAPGQVVVAGSVEDIEWLTVHGREHGIRRAMPLKVAGAFHSSFMESASASLRAALGETVFGTPAFPVWANTTGAPHELDQVAEVLVRQVVEPVRFSESLESMAAEGIDVFVHVGPGDVTAGLARKTVRDAQVVVVSSLSDIPSAVDVVGTIAGR